MLAVTATLYYVTYPFPSRSKDPVDPFSYLQHVTVVQPPAIAEDALSPAWNLWNVLNPEHDNLVHIRIETPVIVVLNPQDAPRKLGSGQQRRDFKPMARRNMKPLWLLKIVILPIGTTTGCLYLLLVYLLKDADLLEAQRNRPEAGSSDPASPSVLPVDVNVKFTTLPRAFATDVEFIAANHDASVIAIVSTEDDLVVWKERYHNVDISDTLSFGPNGSNAQSCITSVAIDLSGRYCAIGTGTGVVATWRLTRSGAPADARPSIVSLSSRITDVTFASTGRDQVVGTPDVFSPDGRAQLDGGDSVVVACDTGSVVHFNIWDVPVIRPIHPSHTSDVFQSQIVRMSNHDRIYVAFTYHDGAVELYSRCGATWGSTCILNVGSLVDPVTKLCVDLINVDESSCLVLGTATRRGAVALWDAVKRECIFLMDDTYGELARMSISTRLSQLCQQCGERSPDGLTMTFSVGHTVFVHRASISSMSKRCTCPVGRKPFKRDSFGRRSRSESMSSVTSSPPSRMRPPSGPTSVADMPAFPVSGHGVHSRRAGSEKDTGRRVSETLSTINSQQEESDFLPFVRSTPSRGPLSPTVSPDSPWRSLVMDQLIDINCERGNWDLIDGQLIGLRRRFRLSQNGEKALSLSSTTLPVPAGKGELTPSVLDRWELWTFDPTKLYADVRVSSLLLLTSRPNSSAVSNPYPRLPFTRISPLIVRSSACVAGFGNTTGKLEFSHLVNTS